MPIRATRSRSIKDLISKIIEQQNEAFSGDSGAPPLETPDIGTLGIDKELALDVTAGAIEGFKDPKSTAAAGAKEGFLKSKKIDDILSLLR